MRYLIFIAFVFIIHKANGQIFVDINAHDLSPDTYLLNINSQPQMKTLKIIKH